MMGLWIVVFYLYKKLIIKKKQNQRTCSNHVHSLERTCTMFVNSIIMIVFDISYDYKYLD